MKAVILSINPQTQVIDVTHQISKFDIRMGAYVLASVAPYFPRGTVHVAVVDPGVGTKRRPIIVETSRNLYVGPDNGLLMLAAHKEDIKNVYAIENPEYMLPHVSNTFHGRDIFAPAAAHLTHGNKPSTFGATIHDYVVPDFTKPHKENGGLRGQILHIDDFGNIISNVSAEDLKTMGFREGDSLVVGLADKTLNVRFCGAYGEVPSDTPLALIGGSNFLELAVNRGSASTVFGATVGESFRVSGAVSS
jgi:hypothetical protein